MNVFQIAHYVQMSQPVLKKVKIQTYVVIIIIPIISTVDADGKCKLNSTCQCEIGTTTTAAVTTHSEGTEPTAPQPSSYTIIVLPVVCSIVVLVLAGIIMITLVLYWRFKIKVIRERYIYIVNCQALQGKERLWLILIMIGSVKMHVNSHNNISVRKNAIIDSYH